MFLAEFWKENKRACRLRWLSDLFTTLCVELKEELR
jgi:hypothetical protein